MKIINGRYITTIYIFITIMFMSNMIFGSQVVGPVSDHSLSQVDNSYLLNGRLHSFYKSNKYDLLNLEDAPKFESAFKLDGSGTTQVGGQAEDGAGNIYVAGGFTDSLSFNTPQGVKTLISTGYYDVFLAKYDPSGNCLWVRNAQGYKGSDSLSIDGAIAIAVDKSGNVYIGGGFVKTLSFLDNQSNAVAKLSSADTTLYNFELFVAKYNTDGNLLWAEGGMSGSHGSAANLKSGINGVTSIVLDADNLPYIGGRFSGANFLGHDVGLEEDGDFFLAALDPDNGSVAWGTILGTPGEDGVLSLAMDVYGYINALGFMGQGTILFPTSPETTLTNDKQTSDTFIAKFDVTGKCLWADLIGGDETIRGVDVAADTLGNIFIAGYFSGTATFAGSDISLTATGSQADGYLAKYDFNGNCMWARRFGGQSYAQSNSIVVDEVGNSFDFGIYDHSAVFGSESPGNEVTLTANNWVDMFVAAYDSSGNFLWTKKLDCTGYGGVSQITNLFTPGKIDKVSIGNNPLSLSYSKANGGEIIMSGDFNDQLFLDSDTLTANNNTRNAFIAKLKIPSKVTAVTKSNLLPSNYTLLQNYPNPFNPSTTIGYQLATASKVSIEIFDALGRRVAVPLDKEQAAGDYKLSFNASKLSNGIYFYRMKAGNFVQTKKMILLK